MYTGIVHGTYEVVEIEKKADFQSFALELCDELLVDLVLGASVAVDGTCLTVSRIDGNRVGFDVVVETLEKTTLSELSMGTLCNVERSAIIGQENGGHEISGHIDGTLEVVAVERSEDNLTMTLKFPESVSKYVFEKGFLAIHGASLTVSYVDKSSCTFKVFLIPETLRLTNLDTKQVGDQLNFEVERKTQAIVDTVISFLSSNPDMLKEIVS